MEKRNENIINIHFGKQTKVETPTIYQYDTGQILVFDDVADGIECHFFNGEPINKIIYDGKVQIPDTMLAEGRSIDCYIYLIEEDYSETIKYIYIPVKRRPKPADYIAPDDEPTFREQMEEIMNETEAIAQSVRDDADNGVFTPVKGQDYFTPEDIAEVRGGLVPETRTVAELPLNSNISSSSLAEKIVNTIKGSFELARDFISWIQSYTGTKTQQDQNTTDIEENRTAIEQTDGRVTILENGSEQKANKVTSISKDSTDIQYPSAKCVYDNIDKRVKVFECEGSTPTDATGLADANLGDLCRSSTGRLWYVVGFYWHPRSQTRLGVVWKEIISEDKVDYEISDTSKNPVQNKIVKKYIDNSLENKQDKIDDSNKLNSDYVNDSNQNNKFVTTQEKEQWNEKVDSTQLNSALDTKQDTLTSADKQSIGNIFGEIAIGNENLINPLDVLPNTIISSTGEINSNPEYTWNCYKDILIKPETTYTLQKKNADSMRIYIGYYKEDGTFISRPYFTTTRCFQFTTPALVHHIAIAYKYTNSERTEFYDYSEFMLSEYDTEQDYKAYYKIANGYNQEFDKTRYSFSAFKKFAIIGDSLSVGYNWDKDTSRASGRNIAYSWGQAIARIYGNECVNMGASGIDTTEWLNSQEYGIGVLTAEGNKCQAYCIGLGINDSINENFTINDFKNNYQAIINAIKNVNPTAKIFCFTMRDSAATRDIKNQAIKEVTAANTNAYIVDINDEYKDVFNTQIIRDYSLGNHYTAGGYVNIGMIISWIISNIMDKNADDFWDIFKIPYDAALTIDDLNEIKADKTEIPDVSNFITKNVNDLTYYTLATDTGHSIELSINSSTFVMTLNLKNSAGTTISTGTIDLPLESVVVNGVYDSTNKKIILTLQSGSTIEIPVGDLVSGLQTEITPQNKLDADLVDDTTATNKFTTTAEKNAWNGKVSDVQINGTSITNDGVANIPIAGATRFGVVKVDSGYGIAINPNYNFIYPVTAALSPINEIKPGSTPYRVIAPSNQHAATFYGLAKAAGDTTQSASANAVGIYTDTAKQKIQEMLGIVTLTQTEYDALTTKSPSTIYIITED